MKNTKLYRIVFTLFLFSLAILNITCKKDFLDKKPSTDINVPTSLNDLQLLLDNTFALNQSPGIGEVSSDDYFMDYDIWKNLFTQYYANLYVWATDIFAGTGNISDWNVPYKQILYANVTLEQLRKIDRNASNRTNYDNIQGTALFLRAWSFFDIAQIFSVPYDNNSASKDLGIPLRLTADINAATTRSTIEETYNQILSDALEAKSLLSKNNSLNFQNRPSKSAAFGLLSRIYLAMRNYSKAGLYADSALILNNQLIDYNTINTTSSIPFTIKNNEVIFYSILVSASPTSRLFLSQGYSIDKSLYQQYDSNDLRKILYFSVNGDYINKKFGYSGGINIFNGLAIDELYLTRAECFIRQGNLVNGLNDLNNLLLKRWKTGTYVPYNSNNPSEILNKVLLERRKELVMRGLRWNDIRRLNKEGSNIVLTRILNGQIYTLPPNDSRYALPIPPDVISLSGIAQNKR